MDILGVQIQETRCIAGLAGLSPEAAAVALSLAATVPLLLIPSLEKLSYLNFVGCASTVLVVATIVASVGLDPTRKRQPVQVLVKPEIPRGGYKFKKTKTQNPKTELYAPKEWEGPFRAPSRVQHHRGAICCPFSLTPQARLIVDHIV